MACTAMRFPPTDLSSCCHCAALGQPGSAGRRRRTGERRGLAFAGTRSAGIGHAIMAVAPCRSLLRSIYQPLGCGACMPAKRGPKSCRHISASLNKLLDHLCFLDQVESPCSKVAAEQAIDSGQEDDKEGCRENIGVECLHDRIDILCKEDRHDHAERNPTARNEKRCSGGVVRHSLVAKQRIADQSGHRQRDGPGSQR